MATSDLNTAIKNLEAASRGTDVKAAVLALLEALTTVDLDAKYLNNKESKHYVFMETIERYERLKTVPFNSLSNASSEPKEPPAPGLMKGGDLYNFFQPIIEKLKAIAGNVEHGVYDKDIQSLLTYINNRIYDSDQRIGIKSAIENNKSITTGEQIVIPDTASVSDYGDIMMDIDVGANVKVKPLTVDKLDFHKEASKNSSGEYTEAFNPITVNVPLKLGQLTPTIANVNGTYDANKYGFDAWESASAHVEVENPNSSGSSSGSSGGSSSGKRGAGTSTDDNYKLISKEVTANGDYSASSEGADGFSSVDTTKVNTYVIDPDKRFIVTFVDEKGEELDKVEDVVPGSSIPISEWPEAPEHEDTGDIWVFNCWNPEPVNILCDMTCQAEYSRAIGAPLVHSTKIQGSYIDASWDEICSDGGASVKEGGIKPLFMPMIGYIRFKKVAKAESTANSVWMAIDAIGGSNVRSESIPLIPTNITGVIDDSKVFSWDNSVCKQWLNSTFIEHFLPQCIQDHLANMQKFHIHTDDGETFVWHGSDGNKIWPASIGELDFYRQGEKPEEFNMDCKLGKIVNKYKGPYFQQAFGSEYLAPGINGSFYAMMRGMNIEGYTDASIREKIECMLPHMNNEQYVHIDRNTGDKTVTTNFDQLGPADKVYQLRNFGEAGDLGYAIPSYDLNKIECDYINDIPFFGAEKYDWTGLDLAHLSFNQVSGTLRDSCLNGGSFSPNYPLFGISHLSTGRNGSSGTIPSIGVLAPSQHTSTFGPYIYGGNIRFKLCFGLR